MSKLFLVPTPIGNLRDITFRAVEVLEKADLILAEDTREARKLLSRYRISTPVQSHHMFNEHKTVEAICSGILTGKTVALISDAGTPGISIQVFFSSGNVLKKGLPSRRFPGPLRLFQLS